MHFQPPARREACCDQMFSGSVKDVMLVVRDEWDIVRLNNYVV